MKKYIILFLNKGQQKSRLEQMDVSENSGTPKSSILIGFSIINHPFWDTPIFGTTQINHDHGDATETAMNHGMPPQLPFLKTLQEVSERSMESTSIFSQNAAISACEKASES